MVISVKNITSHSASVTWPSSPGCLGSFYSIMYHPTWDSILMGFTRKNLHKENRVPAGQTTTSLLNLSPGTTYVLCVTCWSATSPRDRCQTFNTPAEDNAELGDDRGEVAMGVWLASSILLLLITVILLYSCFHPRSTQSCSSPDSGYSEPALPPDLSKSDTETRRFEGSFSSCGKADLQLATIVDTPLSPTNSHLFIEPVSGLIPLSKHEKIERLAENF